MRPEHIRIQPEEQAYGEKNILNAQLESISLLKHQEAFRNLRNEEFMLKLALKIKLEEATESLSELSRLLPKPSMPAPKEMHHLPLIPTLTKQKTHHRASLEQEMDEIKRRLQALR